MSATVASRTVAVTDRVKQTARSAVVIRFRLVRRARVTFLVQGPAPACKTAGRLRVRGHRGINRIRVTSTISGRALTPGLYRIVPRAAGPASMVVARVVSGGRILPVTSAALPAKWCATRNSRAGQEAAAVLGSTPPGVAALLERGARAIAKASTRKSASTRLQTTTAKPAIPRAFHTSVEEGSIQRLLALVFGVISVFMLAVTVLGSAWRGARV